MKHFNLFIFLFFTGLVSAQIHPHAIGVRLSAGTETGGEISYQHGLSDKNRLEFNVGAASHRNYSLFNVSGTYQ